MICNNYTLQMSYQGFFTHNIMSFLYSSVHDLENFPNFFFFFFFKISWLFHINFKYIITIQESWVKVYLLGSKYYNLGLRNKIKAHSYIK